MDQLFIYLKSLYAFMFFEHLHKLHKLMKHTTHLHFKEGSSCQGNPLMYLLPGYTSITGTLHSHWESLRSLKSISGQAHFVSPAVISPSGQISCDESLLIFKHLKRTLVFSNPIKLNYLTWNLDITHWFDHFFIMLFFSKFENWIKGMVGNRN